MFSSYRIRKDWCILTLYLKDSMKKQIPYYARDYYTGAWTPKKIALFESTIFQTDSGTRYQALYFGIDE